MIILGINYFFHDTSACIVKDGELVIALEEERFSRNKHTTEFPHRAISRCLKEAKLTIDDIDHIALSINPTKDIGKKVFYALTLGRRMLPFLKHEFFGSYFSQRSLNNWLKETWSSERDRPEIHFVNHHEAHVIGSYYTSPYKDAALLSMDGSGEWSTTWIGSIEDGKTTCLSESFFPNSLGSFYEAATQFCGFRPNYDEGKTMGLAPFGDSTVYYDQLEKLITISNTGKVHIDLNYFAFQNAGKNRINKKYIEAFGKERTTGPIEKHHEDMAASVQKVLEDKVLEICKVLEKNTKADYLVIAGGVSLNSVVNGRILRETRFKDIYVMPAAGDNGTSIGAAYYVLNHILGENKRFHHNNAYVGTEYSNDEIETVLKKCKLNYRKSDDVCVETAKLLFENNIICWFQGKMEIGPRALGNRSILANPTNVDMKSKINAEVKYREPYRPFAPSSIEEDYQTYFDIDVSAPFMLKVCQVREEYVDKLPAITHVDGSARLQTVHANTNPRYHRLISEFGKLSNISVVLNTSFNVMGEPIAETPQQAIRCFFSTGLDYLVIGDYIVSK